jgi:hypothetical protein
MEPHYRLVPPCRVERLDELDSVVLPIPYVASHWAPVQKWGVTGSGPNATAATLLLDALGSDVPGELPVAAQELVADILSALPADHEAVITVHEIRAWARERLRSRLERRSQEPSLVMLADVGAMLRRRARERGGAGGTWLERFRTEHGGPDLLPEPLRV